MSIAAGSPMAPVARKRQRNEVGGSSPTSIIPETSPHQEIGGQQKDQFSISNQPYTCRGRSAWQSIGRRRSCTSITLTSARVQPPTAAARRSFSSNGAEFEFGGAEDVETSAGPATPTNAVEGTPRRQLRGFQKRREELRQTGALAVPSFVPSAGFASPIVYPLGVGISRTCVHCLHPTTPSLLLLLLLLLLFYPSRRTPPRHPPPLSNPGRSSPVQPRQLLRRGPHLPMAARSPRIADAEAEETEAAGDAAATLAASILDIHPDVDLAAPVHDVDGLGGLGGLGGLQIQVGGAVLHRYFQRQDAAPLFPHRGARARSNSWEGGSAASVVGPTDHTYHTEGGRDEAAPEGSVTKAATPADHVRRTALEEEEDEVAPEGSVTAALKAAAENRARALPEC